MSPDITRQKQMPLLAVAIACGAVIGWMDSRPNWDDTGITAGTILLVTALGGARVPRVAWAIALCVGVPVILMNFFFRDAMVALPVLVIAFVGAYAGVLARKVIFS